MTRSKFSQDLDTLLLELQSQCSPDVISHLKQLRDRLISLKKKRLVKINHSILEMLVARYLIESGFNVNVEEPIGEGTLIADIIAHVNSPLDSDLSKHSVETATSANKSENLLVEIETGYVPPYAALNPGEYRQARIAAKLARYSCLADRFAFATPFYHLLQIPQVYLHVPSARTKSEMARIKEICDTYYQNPPISLEGLNAAELDSIYLIDVDNRRVSRLSPRSYLEYLRGPSDLFKALT